MNDKVTKVKREVWDEAMALAKEQDISMADAISKLVNQGTIQPTSCQLEQFRRVLEEKGITPPKHPDMDALVWKVADLPPNILAGTKFEPYADAKREAELRCSLGNELFHKLITEQVEVKDSKDTAVKPSTATKPVASTDTLGQVTIAKPDEVAKPIVAAKPLTVTTKPGSAK